MNDEWKLVEKNTVCLCISSCSLIRSSSTSAVWSASTVCDVISDWSAYQHTIHTNDVKTFTKNTKQTL